MKNYLFIAAASLLITGCNQDEIDKTRVELDKSSRQVDSLQAFAVERETAITDFVSSFNEIESNLDSITTKQKIILRTSDELKKNKKDRVNEQIRGINDLMTLNQKMIVELTKKLNGASYKNVQFEKSILMMNEQLAQKDIELAELNEQLLVLNFEVEQLQTSVGDLTMQNDQQVAALHTAYYVIGKSKELEGSKIIDREGGLLGIGKTSKLNENFDKSRFTKIDYTQMNKIPVNSDEVKIVTTHPSGSYTLDKDSQDKDLIKNIIIVDPEKFWSASKYLVVVAK